MNETEPHSPKTTPRNAFLSVFARAFFAQVIPICITFGAIAMAARTAVPSPLLLPAWGLALCHGGAAAFFSRILGLSNWWQGIQFTVAALAWIALAYDVPNWAFLAVFVGLALVFTNVVTERVPLYLTNRTTWAALSELIDIEQPKSQTPTFIDLGCGVGGALSYLAKSHPTWSFIGVETAPVPYLISKLRLLGVKNAQVRYQSLWTVDLSAVDVAYAFLSPAPMPRLLDKVDGEMKLQTLFISNSFWAPDKPYDGAAQVNDGRKTSLFFKRIEKV